MIKLTRPDGEPTYYSPGAIIGVTAPPHGVSEEGETMLTLSSGAQVFVHETIQHVLTAIEMAKE